MALISGVEIWKTNQDCAAGKGFACEVSGDAGCMVRWFKTLEECLREVLNYPDGWQVFGEGKSPW
jgi:hypothetical protein